MYVELARNPQYEQLAIERGSLYFEDISTFSSPDPKPLMAYATTVLVDGWLMLLFLVMPLASLVVTRGKERRAVTIVAGTGWLLILASAATTDYDPRYAAVALPALSAGSASALGAVAAMLMRISSGRRERRRPRKRKSPRSEPRSPTSAGRGGAVAL